jgi:hypothetical protein
MAERVLDQEQVAGEVPDEVEVLVDAAADVADPDQAAERVVEGGGDVAVGAGLAGDAAGGVVGPGPGEVEVRAGARSAKRVGGGDDGGDGVGDRLGRIVGEFLQSLLPVVESKQLGVARRIVDPRQGSQKHLW